MKKLLPLFLLIAHLFSHEDSLLCTLASDPEVTIAGCVNAITGQLVIAENDLIIKAAQPLILPRSYTSASAPKNHWDFYPHLRLELYKKYKGKTLKNHYIQVRDVNGVLYRYKQPKNDKLYHLDLERQKDTIVNTSSGVISGETNIRNSYISEKMVLSLGDGTKRFYKMVPSKPTEAAKSAALSKVYYLSKEELPNGNSIHYEYDNKQRLTLVYTASPTGHCYAYAKYTYLKNGLPGDPNCTVKTSDGRTLNYQYTLKKKPTLEASYFLLTKVKATHFPQENLHYREKGPLKRISSAPNRLLEFKYLKEGDNTFINRRGEEENILISKSSDKRRKRVFEIIEPTAPNQKPEATHHFIYNVDGRSTEVRGPCGEKTIYKYTKGLRPYKIIQEEREETFTWNKGNLVKRELKGLLEEVYEYDEVHNVLRKTVNGISTEFAYNDYNRLVYQKEPSGCVTRWTYLGKTNLPLSKTIHGLSHETYRYNEDNLLVEKTYQSGSTHTLTRIDPNEVNGLPEVIQEFYIDKEGEHLLTRSEFTYDQMANVVEKRIYDNQLKLQQSLKFNYDKKGQLTSKTDPLNQTITYQYNDFGGCTKEVHGATGLKIIRRYDACNRLIKVSENGLTTTYTYDQKHRKTSETNHLGQTTHFAYDRFDNLIKLTHPNGDTQEWTYDIQGALLTETNGEGQKTTYTPSIFGSPTSETTYDKRKTIHEYNAAGHLIKTIDPLGRITYYERDPFGRVTKQTLEAEDILETTLYIYDGEQLIEEKRPGDLTITYHYDGAGRKISETTTTRQGDLVKTYTYDSLSRITSTSTQGDNTKKTTTLFSYDALGRITKEELVGGQIITYTYDGHGNKSSITETIEGGPSTEYFLYDPLNRLVETTNPLGHKTTIRYVETSHFTKITTEPNGRQTTETYDSKNRLSKVETTLDGTSLLTKTYQYDKNDRITHEEFSDEEQTYQIERTYDCHGNVISLLESGEKLTKTTYTKDNQKATVTKPDGVELQYTYDAKGRLIKLTSSDDTINDDYEYDQQDHLIRINNLYRTYNQLGYLVEETLPTGLTFKRSFDLRGRKTKLTLPNSETIHYEYDNHHLYTIQYKDWTHHYVHNNEGLLKEEINIFGEKITHSYDLLGREVSRTSPQHKETFDYFDILGNLLQRTLNDRIHTYTYDALDQLTYESGPIPHHYRCDALHNRREKNDQTYDIDNLNQILSTNITYDENGNLVRYNDLTLTYDALDRLTTIYKGPHVYEYTYDGLHRCIAKRHYKNGELETEHHYLYDDQNEIGYIENDQIKELRILGLGRGAEIGAAVAHFPGPAYPTHTISGNLIALTTPDSATRTDFTAFGEQTTSPISHWGYQSKRLDPETGFINFGRRLYIPELGRFLSPDPLGHTAGPNLYAYLKHSPLLSFDEYGLLPIAYPSGLSNVDTLKDSMDGSICGSAQFATRFVTGNVWLFYNASNLMRVANDPLYDISNFFSDYHAFNAASVRLEEWVEGKVVGFIGADVSNPNFIQSKKNSYIGWEVGTFAFSSVKNFGKGAQTGMRLAGKSLEKGKLLSSADKLKSLSSKVSKSQLTPFHEAAKELSYEGKNNIRILRNWAKSKGWKKLPNPEGKPEVWGKLAGGKFQWHLKIKPIGSQRNEIMARSRIPRASARIERELYVNPFSGEIGSSNVGSHIPLETLY